MRKRRAAAGARPRAQQQRAPPRYRSSSGQHRAHRDGPATFCVATRRPASSRSAGIVGEAPQPAAALEREARPARAMAAASSASAMLRGRGDHGIRRGQDPCLTESRRRFFPRGAGDPPTELCPRHQVCAGRARNRDTYPQRLHRDQGPGRRTGVRCPRPGDGSSIPARLQGAEAGRRRRRAGLPRPSRRARRGGCPSCAVAGNSKELLDREHALANRIRRARADARQGHLTPSNRQGFKERMQPGSCRHGRARRRQSRDVEDSPPNIPSTSRCRRCRPTCWRCPAAGRRRPSLRFLSVVPAVICARG